MKLLDFISLEHRYIEIEDEDDLEALIRGELEDEDEDLPTEEVPITMDATEIKMIVPSIYSSKWTDVHLKDGDILTAQMDYLSFKVKWLEALNILHEHTFKDLSSMDEKMNFRCYKN